MARYTEKSDNWERGKALVFFANFIRRHDRDVENNDTFIPVAELLTSAGLKRLVKEAFPEKMIVRMQSAFVRRDRLDFDDEPREIIREIWCAEFARPRLRRMLKGIIDRHFEEHPLDRYADEPFARRCAELQKTLLLSDFELDLLLVFAFVDCNMLHIADGHSRRTDEQDKAVFAAKCLDCDVADVLAALDENNKLRRYNCIDGDFDFNCALRGFLNGARREPLSSSYFSLCDGEVLPWEFYGDLAEKHGAIIKRIIRSADGKSPVNILLYGAPGTGKTSFARTLAAELGRKCYAIAQNPGERGGRVSSSSAARFGALQVCDGQVDKARSLIVVDEADEMLRGNSGGIFALFGFGAHAGDKGLLNSVLDTVTTPTVWITNTRADELDESSRRRFDYSVRFDALNAKQRLSIWRNNVEKMDLAGLVSEEMMRKFSARYSVSAGGISLTLQNLAKLSPAPEEVEGLVETLLQPHCELLGVREAVDDRIQPARDYSLEGLNIKGDVGLDSILSAVRNYQRECARGVASRQADRPRMNLLLWGPPGTGKTEYVKYLGAELRSKVVVKMGSDLLDMYVGGTEERIAAAFAEAEAERAILFLDEIDGLLQSRTRADHSWEVTQVNELLHQMENFGGIMVGATNFFDNLDQAVLRRFTFKIEFGYLDDAGKRIFFERMFKSRLSEAEAARLDAVANLAPGDFRTVRQSLYYLGSDVDNAMRIGELEKESAMKSGARHAKIGF